MTKVQKKRTFFYFRFGNIEHKLVEAIRVAFSLFPLSFFRFPKKERAGSQRGEKKPTARPKKYLTPIYYQ